MEFVWKEAKNMQGINPDRRVQKTRQLLKDALISLISQKGFKEVTIQEILDRANVGRSTFYLHFNNKDELLHSCFEDFNNRLSQHYSEVTARQETDDTGFITAFFHFVEKNHIFVKSLMGEHGLEMCTKGIHDYVYAYFERTTKNLNTRKRLKSIEADMLTHYVTSALIGVLKWWVESDMPCTADEMGQYIIKQVNVNIRESSNI